MKKSVMKAAAYTIIVVPSAVISSTTYALYGLKMTIEVLFVLFLIVLFTVVLGVLEPIEQWVASTRVFKVLQRMQKECVAVFSRLK